MSTSEYFEYAIDLPDAALAASASTLVGFDERYARLEKQLRLISDPASLRTWSRKYYNEVLPLVERVAERYPLCILQGDVGTGKTAFARGAANRLAERSKKQGTLFGLSTRVRGEGKVGEASSRINLAFNIIIDNLGKAKLCTLLIDEADSLVTTRSEEHSHLEDKVAVNTIIQKVDDLRRHGGRLIVFLATNRAATLDAAILRRAAVIETFERPNESERRALLTGDLAGAALKDATITQLVEQTGPQGDRPGFTFSDLRTRLLPQLLMTAYPERRISDDDALAAVQEIRPSPVVS